VHRINQLEKTFSISFAVDVRLCIQTLAQIHPSVVDTGKRWHEQAVWPHLQKTLNSCNARYMKTRPNQLLRARTGLHNQRHLETKFINCIVLFCRVNAIFIWVPPFHDIFSMVVMMTFKTSIWMWKDVNISHVHVVVFT